MKQQPKTVSAPGLQPWRTDCFVPQYKAGEIGPWRINPGGSLVYDRGYFSGTCLVEMLPSLSRKVPAAGEQESWEIWMSLTPLEIESQELGYRGAFGNVAIMGLGMGWIAANAALNSRVTSVTVVERDPDVTDLFHRSGAHESLPQEIREKMTIVNADATEWCPGPTRSIDFLFADIWLHLAEPQTLDQVRQMQKNINAESIYFWGQEITIHAAIRQQSENDSNVTPDAIRRAVADVIQLPLLIPDDCDYAAMITQVFQNRVDRQLPVDIPFS